MKKMSHYHDESCCRGMKKQELLVNDSLWLEDRGMKVKMTHYQRDDFAQSAHPF